MGTIKRNHQWFYRSELKADISRQRLFQTALPADFFAEV